MKSGKSAPTLIDIVSHSGIQYIILLPLCQSNPIFIVKTQLTERSRITDKRSENHIKKHREHWEREKKVM